MNHINTYLSRLLLGFMAVAFSVSLSAQTIYEVVANSADHNTLELAIDTAQLRGALDDPNASLNRYEHILEV